LKDLARQIEDRRIAQRLSGYLDWYDLMERQPAVDAAALSQAAVEGLRSGAYTGLILGESHGVEAEDRAGQKLVRDVLEAGIPVGAFLREENLFPRIEPLDSRRVPVLTYRNQFKPEDDVKAGLKAAGKNLLISYTGCAHTSVSIKDFFLYTLEGGKTWRYESGKRDMPTVEESFLAHRKKPLIVAMSAEDVVLGKVEGLLLKALSDGATLPRLRDDLDAVLSAWSRRMSAYPERRGPIFFVRSPEQPNLYAGLTSSERRAFRIEAARKVLALPELVSWLGGDRIRAVESLKAGRFTPPNTHETHYEVTVHKTAGGKFKRTIPALTEMKEAPTRLTHVLHLPAAASGALKAEHFVPRNRTP
jgi:hypothetical protein